MTTTWIAAAVIGSAGLLPVQTSATYPLTPSRTVTYGEPGAPHLRRTRRDAQSRRPPDADFLTSDERGRLLASCRELYARRAYPFVLTLARTGMRLGEALGLEWGDLDFVERCAVVRRNIVEGRIETPKSGKSGGST